MGVNDQSDVRSIIAQLRTLLCKFGVNRQKLANPTFVHCAGISLRIIKDRNPG